MSEHKFWDVKIGWYSDRPFGPGYTDTTCHISFEYAATAMDALRVMAEWRPTIPPQEKWVTVECTLRASGDYEYVSKRPWNGDWDKEGKEHKR